MTDITLPKLHELYEQKNTQAECIHGAIVRIKRLESELKYSIELCAKRMETIKGFHDALETEKAAYRSLAKDLEE